MSEISIKGAIGVSEISIKGTIGVPEIFIKGTLGRYSRDVGVSVHCSEVYGRRLYLVITYVKLKWDFQDESV